MNAICEKVVVEASDNDARLDKWLTDCLTELAYDLSRSQIHEWITSGYVSGSRPRLKPSDKVQAGEVYAITVPARDPVEIPGDSLPIDVTYEDEDLIVVNKPRGLVVHPAAGHDRGTVVNALVGKGVALSSLGGELRPGVVHRIDKDTSGLLVFAKTDLAYHQLTAQLRAHTMDRIYEAIVHGVLSDDLGLVDAPIGRDPRNRQRMAVVPSGKPAVTHFRCMERFQSYSHAELRLETGRTHQIRVHMAYIGYPLAGDRVYGRRRTLELSGQALHARTLGFIHPRTGEHLVFQANLPPDMEVLLHELRHANP